MYTLLKIIKFICIPIGTGNKIFRNSLFFFSIPEAHYVQIVHLYISDFVLKLNVFIHFYKFPVNAWKMVHFTFLLIKLNSSCMYVFIGEVPKRKVVYFPYHIGSSRVFLSTKIMGFLCSVQIIHCSMN